MKNNIKKKIKEKKGFTLVEALIAIIILAIVSVLMVQGVSMARKSYSSNKLKTEATAIANQEIEKIRAMPYSDVGIKDIDPLGKLADYTTSNGYFVEYNVSWPEDTKRTKQVKVSVSKDPMQNKIEVVTELTPLSEILIAENTTTTSSGTTTTTAPATSTSSSTTTTVPATTTTAVNYPAPYGLTVDEDKMDGINRDIKLIWQKPLNPPYGINYYKIYRTNVSTGIIYIDTITTSNSTIEYRDRNFEKSDISQYKYYVTVVYMNDAESPKSNIVTTTPH
ncbi:MAG: prepilin-type N-terminal cleavage/methylation domain-containing protein [Candidatus Humimicrobiaceae bacterium]